MSDKLPIPNKTETVLKLRDAANQMLLAHERVNDDEVFRSCINSFVSAARSVTMLLERECSHLGMRDWYKAQIKSLGDTPLFKFFSSLRTISIHRFVIQPERRSNEIESGRVWYVDDEKGVPRLHGEFIVKADEMPGQANDIHSISEDGQMWGWYFTDTKHLPEYESGNVLKMCENYFVGLKWLVGEWFREQYRRGIRTR